MTGRQVLRRLPLVLGIVLAVHWFLGWLIGDAVPVFVALVISGLVSVYVSVAGTRFIDGWLGRRGPGQQPSNR